MRKILLNDFTMPMEAIITSNAHLKWYLEEDYSISDDMLDNIIYLTGTAFDCRVSELSDKKDSMRYVYAREFESFIKLLNTYDVAYDVDYGVADNDVMVEMASVYCIKRGLVADTPICGYELCGEKDVKLLIRLLRHIDNEDIYTSDVIDTRDHYDCWPHLSALETLCDDVLITENGTNSAAVWEVEDAGFKHRVVEYDGNYPVRCELKLRHGSVYYG